MPKARMSRSFLRILGSCIRILDEYGTPEEHASMGAPLLGELSPGIIEMARRQRALPLERCQLKVQRALTPEERRTLAAFYTKDSALRYMEAALGMVEGEVVLGDPFMGSGRTLTHLIPLLGDRLRMVWGVERAPLPALVAYTSLLHVLGGKSHLIRVWVGDAFLLHSDGRLPRSNLIATNPPFTRWDKLDPAYRQVLSSVIGGRPGWRERLGRRWLSLQVPAILLIDDLLVDGGVLASVLPASTFYTLYGRGVKELLLSGYHVAIMVEGRDSFSDGSGFKEMVVVARKGREGPTRLIGSQESSEVRLGDLPGFLHLNWLSLFRVGLRDAVLEYVEPAMRSGKLTRLGELGLRIIRGVEMYGPDFFFLPNRHWSARPSGDGIVLKGPGGEGLSIPRDYLAPALRRPSLYSDSISVDVDTYLLSIPPVPLEKLPPDLRGYVEWGLSSGAAAPAVRSRGEMWYSHVWRQLRSKRPFSHLFLPDKIGDPLRRRALANLSRDRVTASKNFYLLPCDWDWSRLLAAWYNSIYFASLLILMGREISRGWTRFLLSDYLEMPVLDPRALGELEREEILTALNELARNPEPLTGGERRTELDLALGRAMGIERAEDLISRLRSELNRIQ